MKRFICIILTAILLLTAVACQKKPDAQEDYIEFETKSQDDNSDNTDTSVPSSEQTPEYPFKDIVADGIGEVFFGLQQYFPDYECTKTHTDADTIARIVGFLNKAPMTQDGYENPNVGNNPPYIIELKDNDGNLKYRISFNGRYQQGYACNIMDYDTSSYRGFYLDGDYLYDLILHIATLDGREPAWAYPSPLSDVVYPTTLVTAIKINGTEYTGDRVRSISMVARYLPMRLAKDTDKKWDDTLKTTTVELLDKDGNSICRIITNNYIEDNNNYHIKLYTADIDGEHYMAEKKHFDALMNIINEVLNLNNGTAQDGYVVQSAPTPENPEIRDLEVVGVNTEGIKCDDLEALFRLSDLVVVATPEEEFSKAKQYWCDAANSSVENFEDASPAHSYTVRNCKVDKVYKAKDADIKQFSLYERAISNGERLILANGEYIAEKGKKYLLFLYESPNTPGLYLPFIEQGKYDTEFYSQTDSHAYPELLKEIKTVYKDEF